MAHGSHGALWSECARPAWTVSRAFRESTRVLPTMLGRAGPSGPHAHTNTNYANIDFTTNQTFAGRSASRRIYHGYQLDP